MGRPQLGLPRLRVVATGIAIGPDHTPPWATPQAESRTVEWSRASKVGHGFCKSLLLKSPMWSGFWALVSSMSMRKWLGIVRRVRDCHLSRELSCMMRVGFQIDLFGHLEMRIFMQLSCK